MESIIECLCGPSELILCHGVFMRRSRSTLLRLPNLSTLILCILIFSTLSFAAAPDRITGPVVSGQMVPLARSLHPRAQPQYDQGAVDPQTRFGYVTLLTSPSASQQRALDKLMVDQQNPSSPNYHKWLTPAQYADRFGLSQNDIDKITTWLKSQGFTVISVGGGRNSIVFSGTAIQIEAAFQTEIHRYKIGGKEHFANATPVKIPAAWAGVVTGVRGLNSFRLRPMSIKKRLRPDYYDSMYQEDYVAPGDIATLYDINALYTAGIDGSGQTLAIVGQTDIYLADINYFRQGFNLPQIPTTGSNACTVNSSGVVVSCSNATNLGYVVVGTDPGTPNLCGDITEADLDIEWSGATARNAQIIYVNSPVTYDSNCNYVSGGGVEAALSAAINPPSGPPIAPVISMSYGACELYANLSDETELQQANVEGVTVLNSAGDSGAAECDPDPVTDPYGILAADGTAVAYPASSAYVTGVGGTAIPYADFTSTYWGTTNGSNGGSLLPPPAPRVPEEAWNDAFEFAAYCTANPSNGFCQYYLFGNPTTALEVQETFGQAAATAGSGSGIAAGGGGASNCATYNGSGQCTAGFPQPSWQTVTITGQTSARFVPDVSLLASPSWPGYIWCTPVEYLATTSQYGSDTTSSCASGIATAVNGIVSGNSYVVDPSIVGGTSASTPVFAGMVALLSQYLGTTNGLGNINPMLYKLAQTKSNGSFNQLATGDTGNNQVYCVSGEPANQTLEAGLICPGTGVLGFLSSNADTKTGYNLVTGLGSVDLNNLAVAWNAARDATSIAVVSSLNPANLGVSVQLTATLTPTGTNTPNGTITIYDGTTALASGALSGGALGFGLSISSLAVGTHSITAVYSGDGYNAGSTSAILNQVIQAPTFNFTNTGSASHTVLAGQTTMTYTFLATPTSASTFAGAVTFGCAFSPTDTTLTSSQCSYSVNGGTSSSSATIPAGSSASTVAMTITTTGPNTGTGSQLRRRADNRSPWLPLALPLAGIVVAGFAGRKVWKHSAIAGLLVSLLLLGLLLACGSSNTAKPVTVTVNQGQPSSVYPNNTGWPSQTAQFTATVTNGTSQAVNWLVTTANGGTIDANGVYTPPTVAAGLPASVTITATSVSNPTQSGSAQETLEVPTFPQTYAVTVTALEGGEPATPPSQQVTLVVQ